MRTEQKVLSICRKGKENYCPGKELLMPIWAILEKAARSGEYRVEL